MFHQTVELDSDFINSAICDIEPFIKSVILPELVGKWFSKQPVMPLQSSNSTSYSSDGTSSNASVLDDTEVNSAETSEVNAPASSRNTDKNDLVSLVGYCCCGQGEYYDNMICCDNKDCVIYTVGWFHFSCLKITKKDVLKGKYYCPDCHMQRSTKRSKSKKASKLH